MIYDVFRHTLHIHYPDLYVHAHFSEWSDCETMYRTIELIKLPRRERETSSDYFGRAWTYIQDNEELHAIWML